MANTRKHEPGMPAHDILAWSVLLLLIGGRFTGHLDFAALALFTGTMLTLAKKPVAARDLFLSQLKGLLLGESDDTKEEDIEEHTPAT